MKQYISGMLFYLTIILLITACNNKPPMLHYKGKDLTGEVGLGRDTRTKQARLLVLSPMDWELYRVDRNDEVADEPLLSGDRPGEYLLSYTDTTYHLFLFKTPEAQAVLSERHLPLQGSFNFRELGGFRTQEGRYTRWGKVFRSDDLVNLTQSDINYLNSIPLHTIVDFRSESEITSGPDKIPSSETRYVPLSITPGNLNMSSTSDISRLTDQEGDSIMRAINIQLANDEASIQQYRKFFALLQNEENLPLVFHCTAGKDRTGFAAYLFLSSLGVDEATIMKDYLTSNQYLEPKYGAYKKQYPFITSLLDVRESYLQSAIEQIKASYGTVENYLDQVLQVDRKKMKQIYLY